MTSGCGAGGGTPWHVPHAACVPFTVVHTGVFRLPPPSVAPWQYVLEQVAAVRSQAGAVATPIVAIPANVTAAVGASMWPDANASAGFTWHTPQSNAGARTLPVTCDACAPTRTASAPFPHVAFGGAPVWSLVPPWHIVQRVLHAATVPFGSVASWQLPHATFTVPPERSCAWHGWHAARPLFAEYAWNPVLVWSVHDAACPTSETVPSMCPPVRWHTSQSERGSPAVTVGWPAGNVAPAWHAEQASGPGADRARFRHLHLSPDQKCAGRAHAVRERRTRCNGLNSATGAFTLVGRRPALSFHGGAAT